MPDFTIEDRQEIYDLSNAYSFYVDTNQNARCKDLFAEDAVFDESCINLPIQRGRENIAALFESVTPETIIYFIHYVTSIWIHEHDAENAKAICYLRGEGCFSNGAQPLIRGYYDDIYKKIDGKWYFKSRKLVPFAPPSGWDYPTSLSA